MKYISDRLNIKIPAARMRFSRLRQELEHAGLASANDVSSPNKSLATKGAKQTAVNKSEESEKCGKKGKRKTTTEEREDEDNHSEKKVKTEEEIDADLII
jgi:hypothetical protein